MKISPTGTWTHFVFISWITFRRRCSIYDTDLTNDRPSLLHTSASVAPLHVVNARRDIINVRQRAALPLWRQWRCTSVFVRLSAAAACSTSVKLSRSKGLLDGWDRSTVPVLSSRTSPPSWKNTEHKDDIYLWTFKMCILCNNKKKCRMNSERRMI